MEILSSAEVITPNPLCIVIFFLFMGGMIIGFCSMAEDSTIGVVIGLIAIVAAIIMIFTIPAKIVEPSKRSYTIEITDPNIYELLVKEGYSFTKLFDTKEIYEIVGDVLK